MPAPSPPIPTRLRELLKDYPAHIEELQSTLDSVKNRRLKSIPPFEHAVWRLEDCLSGFISEARAEVAIAEASGEPQAIARAKAKEQIMVFARSSNIGLANLSELSAFFDANMD